MTTRDAVRAALFTAAWSFLALFGLSLSGWLVDVANWASDSSGAVVFPDPAVLVKALVSAVVAAASGFVGFVVRLAQARGVIGGSAPAYHQSRGAEAGHAAGDTLVTVAVVVIAVVAVLFAANLLPVR